VSEPIPDYRDVLLRHFELKRAKRPNYSLRMFARDLNLTPSNLSDVLKGRCGISTAVASKISQALKFSTDEALFFTDLVESRHARSRADREAALQRVQKHKQDPFLRTNNDSTVAVFTKWYYVATLEFLTMKNGEVEAETVADALGITDEQAHEALSQLLTSGQIRRESGKFVRNENYLFAESPVPSEVIRAYHRQVLTQAQAAIETQPMSERKFLTTMMTFNASRLAEAIAYLEEVDREFFTRFEAKEETDSVYAFGLQLFRIDKKQETEQ
jgi:uncharacterized protein (TIGR02147 family)